MDPWTCSCILLTGFVLGYVAAWCARGLLSDRIAKRDLCRVVNAIMLKHLREQVAAPGAIQCQHDMVAAEVNGQVVVTRCWKCGKVL